MYTQTPHTHTYIKYMVYMYKGVLPLCTLSRDVGLKKTLLCYLTCLLFLNPRLTTRHVIFKKQSLDKIEVKLKVFDDKSIIGY